MLEVHHLFSARHAVPRGLLRVPRTCLIPDSRSLHTRPIAPCMVVIPVIRVMAAIARAPTVRRRVPALLDLLNLLPWLVRLHAIVVQALDPAQIRWTVSRCPPDGFQLVAIGCHASIDRLNACCRFRGMCVIDIDVHRLVS